MKRLTGFGILAVLCASCAAPQSIIGAPQPSAPVAGESGSVGPSAAASSEAFQVTNIDGSCPTDEAFVASLKSVAATATTVVGSVISTGRYVVASPDLFATSTTVVYAEVKVHVERHFIGPKTADDITVYLPGGSRGGFKTTVGPSLENSWAVDGKFFGTVRPTEAIDGGYAMESLPLVGATIAFPGNGCREPNGLLTVQNLSQTVLVLNDGKPVETSGKFATAQLAEVARLLG